jgi:hypothetical protein
MGSRTLNGLNQNTSVLGFSLLKQNNLSDLTSAAFARNNLGLIGSLTGGTNINLVAYNGTANATISAFGNSNSTPYAIASYNSIGELDIRNNNIKCNTYTPLTDTNITFKNFTGANVATLDSDGTFVATSAVGASMISATAYVSSPVYRPSLSGVINFQNLLGVSTATLLSGGHFNVTGSIISPSYRPIGSGNISFQNNLGVEFARISQTGAFVGSDELTINNDNGLCSVNLNCTAAGGKNYKIISTTSDNLGAGNLQIYNQTNTIESIRISGNDNSTRIFGALLADGGVSSSGLDISFNNKNIRNIGNITKQLWSPINSTFQSFSSLSSMLQDPLTNNPNQSFSAGVNIFTLKLSIPLTYNNETFLRMSFHLQSMTIGTTLSLYLRISTPTGVSLGVLATNSINMTPDQVGNSRSFTVSLSALGLIVGSSYMITLLDTAGIASCSYRLNCPELSLLY